jgi:hypothetical protein
MQLWMITAAIIYLGSYLPLSIILMAQDVDFGVVGNGVCPYKDVVAWNCASPLKHPGASVAVLAVCALCFLVSIFALKILPTKHRISIIESKHIPADLFNYVVPYILSFVSLDYSDKGKLFGFLIFLAWIFWITFKSGQIVMNPVLAVLGWKLYEVKFSFVGSVDELTGRILSTTDIVPNSTYNQGSLQDVMIVKGQVQEIDQ